jgi:hypothetical protein
MVFEKNEATIVFMYCDTSRKIMNATSKTHPASMFMYKDIDDITNKLLEGEWTIAERYDKVEL